MDNLHGSPDIAWAWVAGLWLGDGSFGLYNSHNGKAARKTRYQKSVVFANTDKGTCEALYHTLRHLGVGAYFLEKSVRSSRRPLYQVSIGTWGKVKRACEGMLPYLADRKRREAEILIEAASMGGNSTTHRYTPEQHARMRELIDEMAELKKGNLQRL